MIEREPQLPTPRRFGPFAVLMFALAVWTILLAAGAFLYGYREDFRKPLIVLAAMAFFLTVWGGLLWWRFGRKR